MNWPYAVPYVWESPSTTPAHSRGRIRRADLVAELTDSWRSGGAERALRDALDRQGSDHLQAEIQNARARIRYRLGVPAPDQR